MSRWEDDLIDEFLSEVPPDEVEALSEALAGTGAGPGATDVRARLLSDATTEGRFERFVSAAADLLDVDAAKMRQLLDRIGDPSSWYASKLPDVSLIDLEGGPRVADAITGFIRMPAGAVFPEHAHLGDEQVLVLQGSFLDGVSGQVHRPGELVELPAGTAHDFRVRPGPDLVYMVVAQRGIRIGDEDIGPDDPRV